MATLSEDPHSWKAGNIINRDARHTHDAPEVPRYRKKALKKKLCKHQQPHRFTKLVKEYVWPWSPGSGCKVLACEVCGKQKWLATESEESA